jgi:hypothetical protein
MPPRGRPRRPPRTDRQEIKRNSGQWDEKVQAGLDAIFPDARPPTEGLVHALSKKDLAAEAEKARDAPPPPPIEHEMNFDWAFKDLVASAKKALENLAAAEEKAFEEPTAEAEKVHVAPTPPPTESELKFDRELTEQLRDAGAPLPPSWVIDAACEAVPALLRLAAARAPSGKASMEALHTFKELMSERIRDPGTWSVKVRLMLFHLAEELFRAFAAKFPTPDDYQDTLLGVLVPFYNAAHGSRRRCLECGSVFALRTPAEVEKSRHCSEECSARERNRGRDKKHGGRSATESKSTRAGERLIRHMKGCGACQTGRSCDTRERLLITDMSSPPIRFESQMPRRK